MNSSSSTYTNKSIVNTLFGIRSTYRTFADEVAVEADRFTAPKCSGDVVDDDVGEDGSKKTTFAETIRSSGWKTTRGGSGEQSRKALPKNLIHPLPYRITKATGSGDLLSRSPVDAGARDGVEIGRAHV